jgi:hypothetical protein
MILRRLARCAPQLMAIAAVSLAIAVPAHARGVSPKPGYYIGYSGPYTLSFTVAAHGTRVTGLTTDFQANSENGGCMPASEEVHVTFATMAITAGAFHGSTHASSATPTTYMIRGTFAGATRVTGKISESYAITSLPACHDTSPFVAQYVGPSAASAVSTLTVAGAGRTALFRNVSAQFGSLVTPTGTPKVRAGGVAFITYPARRLTSAQNRVLKGPIRSMSLHLVTAGSPFVNTTYRFKGARETRLSTVNPGTIQITLSYTDVTKGR